MKLCILCDNSKVEEVRETGKKIFGNNMRVGVSANGKDPATHWFCFLTVSQEGYDKLLELKNYTTIEESGPKEFLERWNLKVIR